jgi:N-acetylneuraminate synthase
MISTGASTLAEIESAVNAATIGGCTSITLLLCTSAYPTNPREAHVSRIGTLRDEFHLPIGISDHTLGIGTSLAAISLGATTVEKHLTLKRTDGGPDAGFSMEPEEFKMLVKEAEIVAESIGSTEWSIQPSEKESRSLRRSLFITRQVAQGETATRENVRALRPNLGGPIRDIDLILGKTFNANYPMGTAATLDCVD